MKIKLILLILLISCKLSAMDKSTYYSYGNVFDATFFTLPHADSDSVRIIIPFRILNDVLEFKETTNSNGLNIYSSKIEVEIVCTDDGGVIRNRTQLIDTAYVKTYEETNSKIAYYESFFELVLPKRNYSCELSLLKKSKVQSKKLRIVDNSSAVINENLFLYREDNEKNLYNLSPYIKLNAALFDNFKVALLMTTNNPESDCYFNIEYISQNNEGGLYKYWSDEKLIIDGKAEVLKNKDLYFNKKSSVVYFNVQNGEHNFVKISLPFERIIPGEYKVTVYNDKKDSAVTYFNIVWESKPLSLDNIKYAIDLMYYILTDDELKFMKEGSDAQREKKFMEYWKKLDPTQSTPFNESMYQYFSRVDYAFFNFSTLAEKDGAQTDRGKVFILNGPPTLILDQNVKGKPGFIWEYDNLKQRYIFSSVASGFFKLIAIEDIE